MIDVFDVCFFDNRLNWQLITSKVDDFNNRSFRQSMLLIINVLKIDVLFVDVIELDVLGARRIFHSYLSLIQQVTVLIYLWFSLIEIKYAIKELWLFFCFAAISAITKTGSRCRNEPENSLKSDLTCFTASMSVPFTSSASTPNTITSWR